MTSVTGARRDMPGCEQPLHLDQTNRLHTQDVNYHFVWTELIGSILLGLYLILAVYRIRKLYKYYVHDEDPTMAPSFTFYHRVHNMEGPEARPHEQDTEDDLLSGDSEVRQSFLSESVPSTYEVLVVCAAA